MIDKAVFSLWTKPDNGNILDSATNWYRPDFMLYSWVLAVEYAKKWFTEVELVTDDHGYEILVNRLGLKFTSVSLALNNLECDKGFWAVGKIKAYEIQDKPFVHIDNDCILFGRLPEYFLKASTSAQNIEDEGWFESAYRTEYNIVNQWNDLPSSWINDRNNAQSASCLGVVGFNDMKFKDEYCKQSFQLINNSEWHQISNKGSYCIIFEQYIYDAVAKDLGIEITYLSAPKIDKDYLKSIGYCHIWGDKKNEDVYKRTIKRILREYPEYINRIKNIRQ